MTVWVLPIEPFAERYTADWSAWWPDELHAAGLHVRVVPGDHYAGERTGGEWLDPCNTWRWKGTQVAQLAQLWQRGEVRDGDVVLLLDAWGPATTAALYMRETTGRRVKVVGFYHAGASDPYDFLARAGCGRWALDVERGWMRGLDLVLVGSAWSEAMLRNSLGLRHDTSVRVAVVGVPVHQGPLLEHATPWQQRGRVVVFPHRLAPEKQPHLFEAIREAHQARYPDRPTQWVRTRDVYTDKAAYYRLIGRARCAVSCALQETFGIAMQEAVALGAYAVAPRRLSYPEVLRTGGTLYDTVEDAAEQVEVALASPGPALWDGWHELAVRRAAETIKELTHGDQTKLPATGG